MEKIKELKSGNKILRIFVDENAENPRNWENLGKMVCNHKTYNLGDKHNFDFDNCDSWDEVKEVLINKFEAIVILPIYLFDHSGISISTKPFNDRFDSGQVGFIYVTKEDMLNYDFNITEITDKLIELTNKMLVGEVDLYNDYLNGNVFMFEVIKIEKDNLGYEYETIIDSCGGFFGDNFKTNNINEYLDKEMSILLLNS
jgi:hypothetical protein